MRGLCLLMLQSRTNSEGIEGRGEYQRITKSRFINRAGKGQ